jgi:hypothetical protein
MVSQLTKYQVRYDVTRPMFQCYHVGQRGFESSILIPQGYV